MKTDFEHEITKLLGALADAEQDAMFTRPPAPRRRTAVRLVTIGAIAVVGIATGTMLTRKAPGRDRIVVVGNEATTSTERVISTSPSPSSALPETTATVAVTALATTISPSEPSTPPATTVAPTAITTGGTQPTKGKQPSQTPCGDTNRQAVVALLNKAGVSTFSVRATGIDCGVEVIAATLSTATRSQLQNVGFPVSIIEKAVAPG